jgi:predicted ribosome-associated RNA-binding protein Tma20
VRCEGNEFLQEGRSSVLHCVVKHVHPEIIGLLEGMLDISACIDRRFGRRYQPVSRVVLTQDDRFHECCPFMFWSTGFQEVLIVFEQALHCPHIIPPGSFHEFDPAGVRFYTASCGSRLASRFCGELLAGRFATSALRGSILDAHVGKCSSVTELFFFIHCEEPSSVAAQDDPELSHHLPCSMFRKPPNIKSEQKLSDKDAKKLQADAARQLLLSADQAAELMPRKPGLTVRQCGGGMTARIFTSEQRAVAFSTGDGGLVPSLPSVWRLPAGTFATLHVPEPVAGFILNGSDLMLPGVHGVSLPEGADPDACLTPGGIACVAALGNPHAFAVGKLLVGRSEIEAQLSGPGNVKGRCLTTLHVFGDHLWQSSSALLPNSGFVVTEDGKAVHSLEGETAAAAETGSIRGELSAGADEAHTGAATASSDAGEGEADDCAPGQREAQDRLLEACFLQAAHAVSDKTLPLPLNTFYTNHMRPNR